MLDSNKMCCSQVSGDPSCREDCFKGAKFLAHVLEDLGAEVKLVQPFESKNPVIIGRIGSNPELKTVTFYGHYDVQPALETPWKTDPFEVVAIDGYLYGRGTSDNKVTFSECTCCSASHHAYQPENSVDMWNRRDVLAAIGHI